jgi:hypothetical protein
VDPAFKESFKPTVMSMAYGIMFCSDERAEELGDLEKHGIEK